jgi:GNAT superfamily N-acetyltransferase
MNVTIRPPTPGDQAGIRRVSAAALDLEPDAGALPDILMAAIPSAALPGWDRFCLIATDDSVATADHQDAGGGPGSAPADTVAGVCFASPGRGEAGHIDLLAVEPRAWRLGIGRRLLTAAEERLASLGAQAVLLRGNPPLHLWPGVDVRYTAMIMLADRAGYQRQAEAIDMAVTLGEAAADELPGLLAVPSPQTVPSLDTAADERRLAAAGISVRRVAPAEADGVLQWLREGPWGASAWPDEAAAALGRDQGGVHVATGTAGRRAPGGYLGFACYGAVRAGWFGPMGTLEEARRTGVGGVLLKRCLASMRAGGHAGARIGWTGPVRFYADTVGARIERTYRIYRKEIVPVR